MQGDPLKTCEVRGLPAEPRSTAGLPGFPPLDPLAGFPFCRENDKSPLNPQASYRG
jgi:hypothetical protein